VLGLDRRFDWSRHGSPSAFPGAEVLAIGERTDVAVELGSGGLAVGLLWWVGAPTEILVPTHQTKGLPPMSMPMDKLLEVREDTHVLAVVAASDAPLTNAVLSGVARWFLDVEIRYPIAEMPMNDVERRGLLTTVTKELYDLFDQACSSGEMNDEAFAILAADVDPLWREITGLLATQFNENFESERIPAERVAEYLRDLIDRIREEMGDGGVDDFIRQVRTDPMTRAQMRRIGVDPDQL
jgi:hypothetical protein